MLRTKYLIAASVEIKLTLFKAIKEYKLSEDNSMPRNKVIKLLDEIIMRHPINAKTSNE